MTDRQTVDRFLPVYAAMTQTRETLAPETGLFQFIASLLDRTATHPASCRHASAVPKALIDDDPTVDVTLADLAAASGLSRFQVVRAFAQETGMTPHAYLVQRRIGIVRRMIAKGTPLADAAFARRFCRSEPYDPDLRSRLWRHPGVYAQAFG